MSESSEKEKAHLVALTEFLEERGLTLDDLGPLVESGRKASEEEERKLKRNKLRWGID